MLSMTSTFMYSWLQGYVFTSTTQYMWAFQFRSIINTGYTHKEYSNP